jgi:SEC-C motif domain protein
MHSLNGQCYCGSDLRFENCCEPCLSGEQCAISPEALMRSRFCAYLLNNYDYILATYAAEQRNQLSLSELSENSKNTKWLRLIVHHTGQSNTTGKVEFSAYYQADNQLYVMHETSDFIKLNEKWYYTTGLMHKDSGPYMQQRNDLCLCGSGKKFKKCCSAN